MCIDVWFAQVALDYTVIGLYQHSMIASTLAQHCLYAGLSQEFCGLLGELLDHDPMSECMCE